MSIQSQELLSCPFCGKSDELHLDTLGDPNNWFVECDRCRLGTHAVFNGRAAAIAAWNRRADHKRELAAKDEEIKRITAAVAKALNIDNEDGEYFIPAEPEPIICNTDIVDAVQRYAEFESKMANEDGRKIAELEADNASLKAQVERLSRPVSDEEKDRLNAATNYSMGDTWCRLCPYIDALIVARAAKEQ